MTLQKYFDDPGYGPKIAVNLDMRKRIEKVWIQPAPRIVELSRIDQVE